MAKLKHLKVHLPEWLTKMFSEAIWRLPTGKKTLYLTFDDGPIPEVTYDVLAILKEFDIKATFFCVGDNVRKYPEVYKAILNDGHSVGNHTYNHVQGIRCSNKHYLNNIEKADKLINSNMFRPPHGILRRRQYHAIIKKYKLVMWDVISCDYDTNLSPDICYDNVMNFVRDGSIITFHDSIKAKENVLDVLPKVITDLKSEGYEFRKIEFPRIVPFKKVRIPDKIQILKESINKLLKGA